MTQLFTIAELLAATGGQAHGVTAGGIDAVSIDSRDLSAGALFVAIKGDRFDGHDFVGNAIANGAVAAMVSESRSGAVDGPLVVVPDALEGLVDLGRAARGRTNARIVAVTGSVGKTTTKEAIRTALSGAGPTHAAVRSFNNHWGVPLTLARMPHDTEFGIFEIGMNHAGEITPLVMQVRPHIAVITAIAPAHIETLGSLENIARAKAEIFSGIEPGGTALLNADHEQVDILLAEAERAGVSDVITYGFRVGSNWQISGYRAEDGTGHARVRHCGEVFELRIAAAGRHMMVNAVAALATARLCGVSGAKAVASLETFGAPEGRGQRIVLGHPDRPLLLIDESYNANLASMTAALEVFAEQTAPSGRKVLVLGDMLELGMHSADMHRRLAEPIRETGADAVYLVGREIAPLAEALGTQRVKTYAQTVDEIMAELLDNLAYGDAVMIKGSNGVGLGRLVEAIRAHFA